MESKRKTTRKKRKIVAPVEEFHTVEFFRKVKEQMAKEMQGMTFEEEKEYLQKRIPKT